MIPRCLDVRSDRWATLVLALFACTPASESPFVPVLESEHLRIGMNAKAERPCQGFVDLWEAHIEAIEETLGVSRDFAWLYLYHNDELSQITADCSYPPSVVLNGCWSAPVVRSILTYTPHELVHAWTATANETPLPVLQEGIATRMSGAVPRNRWYGLTVDDLLITEPPRQYDRAAHFVVWLMDVYGDEAFMEFYTSTWRGMSAGEFAAATESVLGEMPADLLDAYHSSPAEYYPAMGGAACGRAPKISWRDGAATWEATGSCDEGPFLGTVKDPSWWHVVTIEVPASGSYVLDVGGRRAAMTRCLTDPVDWRQLPELRHDWLTGDWEHIAPFADRDRSELGWEEQVLDLDAGVYEVWVEYPADDAGAEGENGLFRL